MSESLIFTVNAAAKVWELIQEEENYNLKLRVYVTGGGCSGFQYGFKFDEIVNDDDTVVTQKVKIQKITDIPVNNEDQTKNFNSEEKVDDKVEDSESFSSVNGVKAENFNSEDNINGKTKNSESSQETGNEATVQLLVDPISYPYLAGAEIDYKEDLEGAQFIIRNPNAKTTCGCGSSFSAE